jgi:putative peptidoglycan lipid II flippase
MPKTKFSITKHPKRLFLRANKRISLGNAAMLLIVASSLGQLLGFLRTRLVNANFPALGPDSTDAYFAAFKIPDLFFFTLAAGALGVAFIPFLADHLQKGDKKSVWMLSNSLLNLLVIVMAVVGVIIFVFAEPLLHYVVAPNLSPEQMHNASTIMRLIAFNPLLFTITGIFTSVQQTFGRFFFYAIAPLFYNTCIIISAMVFSSIGANDGGPNGLGLIGLGIGALVGAVLQLLIAVIGFLGLGYRYMPIIKWKSKEFIQILKQLPPRSLDQGIDSVNSIVETNLARRLGDGKLSYYENAYTLQSAPTLLIGTTISTAAFPRLTDRLAQGREDLFRKEFLKILRVMVWIIMPIIVVSYFLRGYLARLIFANDAPQIALIFGFFVGAILFRTIYALVSRWFYAQKDTKTPLYVSIFAIALNVFLAYTLSRPTAYDVAGLAMAQSFVALAEVVILFLVMVYRDHKLINKDFWSGIYRIFSVTGFAVITAYIMLSVFPLNTTDRGFFVLGGKLALITLPTFAVYIVMSLIFGLEEARPIFAKIKNIIMKPVKIQ